MDDNQKDKDNDKHRIRTIIKIIIIIIIILLLLMRCGTDWFGRIGGFFNKEANVHIKPDDGTEQIITDKDLKFHSKKIEFSLSDKDARLTFYYKNINPKEFTCVTSDASIATCYVEKDYVVLLPKKEGTVDVTLEAKVNGKIYRATAQATVLEPNRYIELTKTSGTIDLVGTKVLRIPITLVRLSEGMEVSISDPLVADAKIQDDVLVITGKKVGKADITITVEENGKTYTKTFLLKVIDTTKSSDSKLKSLSSSLGGLTFSSSHYQYFIGVSYEQDTLSLDAIPNSSKAHVTCEFNGQKVDSLKNLKLKEGNNKVTITVQAEDGTKSTYEVDIYRSARVVKDSALKDLSVSAGKLTPSFADDVLSYKVEVGATTETFTLKEKTVNENASVQYQFNGKKVDSLKDLELKPGHNKVEITVTDEKGEMTTYTVDVYRKERKVVFLKDSYHAYIEDGQLKVPYTVLEYEENTDTWVEVEDYDENDLGIEFDGNYRVEKGMVTIIPEKKDIDTSKKLTFHSQGETYEVEVEIGMYDYFLESESNSYEFNEKVGGDFVLNNDLLGDEVTVEKTANGIIVRNKYNPEIYIEITGDVTLTYDEGTNSLAVHVSSGKVGYHSIHVKGMAYGREINDFTVDVEVITEFFVNLYANGGFYNEFASEIHLKLEEGSTLNLNEYTAYFSIEETCEYLEAIGYSKRKDAKEGDTDIYPLESQLTIQENLDLYAIYSDVKVEEPKTNQWLYLTEVDFFKNEDYYKEYGIRNMIYPGANGTYLMNITNDTDRDITVTGISLTELKSICLEDGCINMGYQIIPQDSDPIYGKEDYTVLNQDKENMDNNKETYKGAQNLSIGIPKGESKDILIKWKWVEQSDTLDTAIGNYVKETEDDTYSLAVGIQFTSENTACKRG